MQAADDLIAAAASAHGAAGIGVVRLSGKGMPAFAKGILKLKTETTNGLPPPRYAARARFVGGDGDLIDDGLALYFPAPHSFTGQDVLELHGHGGAAVMERLLSRCLQLGARMAQAGEFSQRAYINGKMDLAQAEALCDLINANGEAAARAAAASLDGALSIAAQNAADKIANLRAELEAHIDFADEDLGAQTDAEKKLNDIADALDDLLNNAKLSAKMSGGARAVIAGLPNVGKSSLLNCLCGEDAAIVSPTAGTTRDAVQRDINLNGITVRLTDTAGLRDASGDIESEGITRAKKAASNADLLIIMTDDKTPAPRLTITAGATIKVRNKIDLTNTPAGNQNGVINISAKTGAGINTLREAMREKLGISTWHPPFTARARHIAALKEARAHITAAQKNRNHPDLCCASLEQAQQSTSSVSGGITDEDILAQIFSQFCVGK